MRPAIAPGSVRIMTVRGIPIRVHFSLLLLLPLLALLFSRAFVAAAVLAGVPPAGMAGTPFFWGLFVAVALFVGVLLHELAHSLYAIRRGVKIRGITLMALGGASHLEDMPSRPRDEAVMALVGPLVSLLLGGVLLGVFGFISDTRSFNLRFAVFYLAQLNLFLGVFNLLPAFPMDGGRILRAALTPRQGAVRATQNAARVGKVLAVLFAVLGFLSFNFLLLLIAVFVYFGAQAESQQVLMKATLGKLNVGEMMLPRVSSVDVSSSISQTVDRLRMERRSALPVTSGTNVVGLVTFEAARSVPPDERPRTSVRQIVQPVVTVSPSDDAWMAVRRLNQEQLPLLAVTENDELVGTIDVQDVAQALALSDERVVPPGRSGRGALPSGGRREEQPA